MSPAMTMSVTTRAVRGARVLRDDGAVTERFERGSIRLDHAARAAAQWQGLLRQHCLDDSLACPRAIDSMRGDQCLAIAYDCVGVLHDLQPLEMVGVRQAHARADDLQ